MMACNCCDCIYGELTNVEIEFHFGAEDKDCYCHLYNKFVGRYGSCSNYKDEND